ncbi:ABC transporter permease [Halobellus sp. Atlit-38R]|jgi:osmoprotectant transport system permease protein|uniref:ABC transporter permease n=1 Tax=Halobellus sp. Atlit-38R TaxID=2282131 RepID=UPI000EF26FBF|nr:ABC transporter permease [Halobellus sp. Atlit-38R]RLM89354.1 ABC transporter permease [Halobellus sp. Atlit-38R]
MPDYIGFLIDRWGELVQLTVQHAEIVLTSMAIAIVIGISLGTLITFDDRAASVVLWLAGISMTVPSIALFGLLIPVLGIGSPPVIFALVLYSQLPLVRNTYIGLTEVDDAAVEVGRGMGMTRWERLRYIQIPNALPVIMAGLRNAVIIIVGVAAIGAFIGAGGLGDFIFQGIRKRDVAMIVVTTAFLSAMALVFDYGFGVLEQLFRLRNGEDIERSIVTDTIWKVVT